MIYNGIKYNTIEDLEIAIQDLSEQQKQYIRNDFNGVPNPPEQDLVPKSVTPRQIRLALIQSGVTLSSIDSMIDALPEPNKSVVRVWWEYSTAFERNTPILNLMAPSFGFSQQDLDNLFILAITL